jgi:hypothetical protein
MEPTETVLASPTDIAWAAGLFEGEGCWNFYVPRSGSKTNRTQARLGMTDEDVVRRFATVVGCGKVRGPVNRGNPEHKPMFEWYIQRRKHVLALIELFWPYMGTRRRAKAQEILDLNEARPLEERTHCPQGHAYAGDNLRLEKITRKGVVYWARRCVTCRLAENRGAKRRQLGITEDRFRIVS